MIAKPLKALFALVNRVFTAVVNDACVSISAAVNECPCGAKTIALGFVGFIPFFIPPVLKYPFIKFNSTLLCVIVVEV